MIQDLPSFCVEAGRDYADSAAPNIRDLFSTFCGVYLNEIDEAEAIDLGARLGQSLPGLLLRDHPFSDLDREVYCRNVAGPLGPMALLARTFLLIVDRLVDHRDRLPGALSWLRHRADAVGDVLLQNGAPSFTHALEDGSYSSIFSRLAAPQFSGRMDALRLATDPLGFVPEPLPFSEFDRGRYHFDSGIPFDTFFLDTGTHHYDAVLNLRLKLRDRSNAKDDARLLPADPRALRALSLYRRVAPYPAALELGEKLLYGYGTDFEEMSEGPLVGQEGWLPLVGSPDVVIDNMRRTAYAGEFSLRMLPTCAATHPMTLATPSVLAGVRVLCQPASRDQSFNGFKLRLVGTNGGLSPPTTVLEVGMTRSHILTGTTSRLEALMFPPFVDRYRWHHIGVRIDLVRDLYDVFMDDMLLVRAAPTDFSTTTVDAMEIVADGEPGDVFYVDELRCHGDLEAA